MPFQESMVLKSRVRATDDFKSYPITARVMEGGAFRELPISPELLSIATNGFEVYNAEANPPLKDDIIVDAGNVGWKIVAVVDDANSVVFRCAAVKLT